MEKDHRKKVLLVTSSFEEVSLITASKRQEKGKKLDENVHYPLGLAYLHSSLESKGVEVLTLFLNHNSYRDCYRIVRQRIKEFLPDIVGLQILSSNRISSFQLIEAIHQLYPKIKLVAGGIHATVMHKQIIEKFPFLTVVIGEGEITLPELVSLQNWKKSGLKKIKGIAFFSGRSVFKTRERELVEDLDLLPFPKHEIFFEKDRTRGNILTTRGCPFSCSFCCLDLLSRRRVRKRSVENVLDEIEWMVKKFPKMTSFWIHDDSFFLDNQRVINFCEGVIERKIKLHFTCSGRIKPLSKKMVMKLQEANFEAVLLGLESGSEKLLLSCHKMITKMDAIRAVKLFAKTKIMLHVFIVVGFPGENEKTIKETGDFIQKLQKINYIYYNEDLALLTVYPGTEIYEISKNGGVIDDSYWLSDKPVPLFTLENDQKELFRLKDQLLDTISLNRFLSWQGFLKQAKMTPNILKFFISHIDFIFNNRKKIFDSLLGHTLRKQTRVYINSQVNEQR